MHHMNQLDLVRRSHHNHVRQGGKISDVEAARMSAAISAHQPRAVDSETDGKILDRHVVHNLIVSALQKRSEEHTSELQSLMRISYAVFCLQKKITQPQLNNPVVN